MKKLIQSLHTFLSTIAYCLSLSWESSKLYTTIRLSGKIIMPIAGIASSFLLKYIIDLLSGALQAPDRRLMLVLLIASTVAISLVTALIKKAVSYSEGMHNDILDAIRTLTDSGCVIVAALANNMKYSLPACLGSVLSVRTSSILKNDHFLYDNGGLFSTNFVASSLHELTDFVDVTHSNIETAGFIPIPTETKTMNLFAFFASHLKLDLILLVSNSFANADAIRLPYSV